MKHEIIKQEVKSFVRSHPIATILIVDSVCSTIKYITHEVQLCINKPSYPSYLRYTPSPGQSVVSDVRSKVTRYTEKKIFENDNKENEEDYDEQCETESDDGFDED